MHSIQLPLDQGSQHHSQYPKFSTGKVTSMFLSTGSGKDLLNKIPVELEIRPTIIK